MNQDGTYNFPAASFLDEACYSVCHLSKLINLRLFKRSKLFKVQQNISKRDNRMEWFPVNWIFNVYYSCLLLTNLHYPSFFFPLTFWDFIRQGFLKVQVEELRWRFHTRVQLLQLVYVPSNWTFHVGAYLSQDFYKRFLKNRPHFFWKLGTLRLGWNYWIAFALPRKSYGIGLLFTHKNGCGARDFCNGVKLRRATPNRSRKWSVT